MPHVALALLVAYGILALGVRGYVQWRRTGSTGFVGANSPTEALAGALLVGGFALAVVAATADVERVDALDGPVGWWTGAALAAAGLVVTVFSQFAMGDSWRVGVSREQRTGLVTGGPFGIVRNPIYSGMICFLCGIALLVPSIPALAAPLVLLTALELQTRKVEEPYLLELHGDAYRDYARRVGRFVPGVGRLRS
jgi:protein-S-isoprenylcysteine O-methyltransferase Ste14